MKCETEYKDKAKIILHELKQAAIAKGVTQEAIAAKTGWVQTNVSRTLNGKYIPTLGNLIKLATAIGVKTIKIP